MDNENHNTLHIPLFQLRSHNNTRLVWEEKMSNKRVRIWVAPKFHNSLKVASATKGMSIIQYTQNISISDLEKEFEENKKKRRFQLGF